MNRIHIIGRKNHGKTTLVVDLLQEFNERGLCVGSIKHTHHDHQLDVPGKDSHKHQLAGASVVGVLSRSMSAVFIPSDECKNNENRYQVLESSFQGCDLVLVEGDVEIKSPKIEVWRASVGTDPIASTESGILALVTDDTPPLEMLKLSRTDVSGLADWILRFFAKQESV